MTQAKAVETTATKQDATPAAKPEEAKGAKPTVTSAPADAKGDAKTDPSFFETHKRWLIPTIVGGAFTFAAVLTAGLLAALAPAAFAAIVSFPVFGLTIAGIVGAGAAAQVGFIGALALGLSAVGAGLVEGTMALVNVVSNWFKKTPDAAATAGTAPAAGTATPADSARALSGLSQAPATQPAATPAQPDAPAPAPKADPAPVALGANPNATLAAPKADKPAHAPAQASAHAPS